MPLPERPERIRFGLVAGLLIATAAAFGFAYLSTVGGVAPAETTTPPPEASAVATPPPITVASPEVEPRCLRVWTWATAGGGLDAALVDFHNRHPGPDEFQISRMRQGKVEDPVASDCVEDPSSAPEAWVMRFRLRSDVKSHSVPPWADFIVCGNEEDLFYRLPPPYGSVSECLAYLEAGRGEEFGETALTEFPEGKGEGGGGTSPPLTGSSPGGRPLLSIPRDEGAPLR